MNICVCCGCECKDNNPLCEYCLSLEGEKNDTLHIQVDGSDMLAVYSERGGVDNKTIRQ